MPSMVKMFCVRCPRSRDCNRKGGYIKKGTSEDMVREGLWNHLTNSPYHEGLPQSQVIALVQGAELETWQEPRVEEEAKVGSRGRSRSQRRRVSPPRTPPRQATSSREGVEPSRTAMLGQPPPRETPASSGGQDASAIELFEAGRCAASAKKITLTRPQVEALLDTTMRAMRAAEQADRVCKAAAQAFALEASSLRSASETILSYLSG